MVSDQWCLTPWFSFKGSESLNVVPLINPMIKDSDPLTYRPIHDQEL